MKRLVFPIILMILSGVMVVSAQSGIITQTTVAARFRTGPSSEWRIQATLPVGTAIAIDARDGTNNFWVRGVTPDGTVGWLGSNNTALSESQLNTLPIKTVDDPVTVSAPPAGASASADNNTTSAESAADTLSAPPPVAAVQNLAPISGFGLGGHVSGFGSTTVAYMQQAGMTWVKKQIRFTGGSGSGLIAEAKSKGFRIVLGVVGDKNQLNNPAYVDSYVAFLASLAADGADAIEVWNEPNIDREWTPGQISPQAYTNLLAASYNSIKAANPSTLVISGAPAPTGFFGGCSGNGCDDRPFIQGMAAAGAGRYMDCVGVHYNEGILPPTARSGDPRGNSGYYTRYFQPMIEVYSGAFGGTVPLCFTEIGYLTPEGFGSLPGGFAWASNVTVAQQTAWLDQAVSIARNSGRVRLMIIWNVDFQGGGDDPMGGYAIIRPDGSCPACAALGN